jgi:hypothetical protein
MSDIDELVYENNSEEDSPLRMCSYDRDSYRNK